MSRAPRGRERSHAGLYASALACVLALAAPAARAQGGGVPTIVVVCPEGDRFGLRVAAEVETLGFAAARVEPGPSPASRAGLEEAARERGAIAAIRAVPADRGTEVWIADRVTGKTVLRAVTVVEGEAVDPEAALALRAVELLRASMLEAALPKAPPGEVPATAEIRAKMQLPPPFTLVAPEPPPAPAAPALPAARVAPVPTAGAAGGDGAPKAPVLRLAVAFGLMGSPGGFSPGAVLDAGLAWMPSEHFGVALSAAVPLSRPGVQGAAGSADLAVGLGGLAARFLFTSRRAQWAPTIDAGLAVVGLASNGKGSPGFTSGSAFGATAAPFLRTGLAFAPTQVVRLHLGALLGVAVPGTSIQLAEKEVATWGRPVFGLASVGVDVGLF